MVIVEAPANQLCEYITDLRVADSIIYGVNFDI